MITTIAGSPLVPLIETEHNLLAFTNELRLGVTFHYQIMTQLENFTIF